MLQQVQALSTLEPQVVSLLLLASALIPWLGQITGSLFAVEGILSLSADSLQQIQVSSRSPAKPRHLTLTHLAAYRVDMLSRGELLFAHDNIISRYGGPCGWILRWAHQPGITLYVLEVRIMRGTFLPLTLHFCQPFSACILLHSPSEVQN
jgi:hypothetical protein